MQKFNFAQCTIDQKSFQLISLLFALCISMSHFSATTKHAILLEYSPHDTTRSFAALAQRHGVKGGRDIIRRWHQRWNGTPQSLEEHARSGRPSILTPVEVTRHLHAPILAANRSHRAISYTKLLPEVQRKTGKKISLRTLQNYGQQRLQVQSKHTRKRTSDERKYKHTYERE